MSDSAVTWMTEQSSFDTSNKHTKDPENNQALEKRPRVFFKFNPNTCSLDDFQLLGLNKRQAKMIDTYRSRGGQFRIKNDFKKMYCISADEFVTLQKWIDLPDTSHISSSGIL